MDGQKYIENVNNKIKEATELFKDKFIQIDGGINLESIVNPINLGVNSFVIGSYLSKSEEYLNRIIMLNIQYDFLKQDRTDNIGFMKKILQIVEDGYGKNDILLGIKVPNIRKIAKKWYKYINYNILDYYISSNIHEYRQFAVFCIYYKDDGKQSFNYINKNTKYINNWDLTDIVAPNIIGKYLCTLADKEAKKYIKEYLKSKNIWEKRIGIVLLLKYVREGKIDFTLEQLDFLLYEDFHLIQKANGWVLREAYKKNTKKVLRFLIDRNSRRKLPSILLNYACEKMSKEEKLKVRSVNK